MSLIKFENMSLLNKLDISNTNGENKLVSNLLNKCSSLKSLNISYCLKISDEAFTSATLNCQLEELDLSFVKQVFNKNDLKRTLKIHFSLNKFMIIKVTDLTIEALSQTRNTLKILKLKGCINVTNEGNLIICFYLSKACKVNTISRIF